MALFENKASTDLFPTEALEDCLWLVWSK